MSLYEVIPEVQYDLRPFFCLYLLPSFFRSVFISNLPFASFPFRSETNISDYSLQNGKTYQFTNCSWLKVKYPLNEFSLSH